MASITFNTNLAALGAQRNIGIASNQASSSLSKLSSGSRVPQAKDDAAGLAIGSKLKSEVAGLTQAGNNANQAISLLQIADGALSTVGDILVRMKALAVQSSSGQLADSERSLLNQEFTGLRSEIDRIAQVTNFNGNTLLNGGDVVAESTDMKTGSLSSYGMRVTFDASTTYDSDSTNNTGASDTSDSFRISYDYTDNTNNSNSTAENDTGNLTVTNLRTGASQTIDIRSLIVAKTSEAKTDSGLDQTLSTDLSPGQEVTVDFAAMGVKVTLDSNFNVDADITSTASETASGSLTDATSLMSDLSVTNVNNGGLTDRVIKLIQAETWFDDNNGRINLSINEDDSTTTDQFNFVATNNLRFDVNGAAGTADSASSTILVTTATTVDVYYDDGTDSAKLFTLVYDGASTAISADDTANDYGVDFGNMIFGVDELTTTAKSFNFKVGTGVSTNDSVSFTMSAATTSALGISTATISSTTNADSAITSVGAAITTVSSRRADIGASQSRLDFAAASIAVAIENTTAAQSALLDVDVSAEITRFTSQQVLLQAGVSLLSQANQQPALLLRLLQ